MSLRKKSKFQLICERYERAHSEFKLPAIWGKRNERPSKRVEIGNTTVSYAFRTARSLRACHCPMDVSSICPSSMYPNGDGDERTKARIR
jgi:hypothetical protein